MPELPEVESLAVYLRDHAVGQAVTRVDMAAFSALKTFQPSIDTIVGHTVTGVRRHGKFLDLTCTPPDRGAELHLVFHLSRAGWLRWSDELPTAPPKPGRGPIACRVHLAGGGGFTLTEAGTQKRLAIYLVADPAEVPGVARLGPDPMAEEFTAEALHAILTSAGRAQIKGVLTDQARVAGVGNAYSDEILHAAKLSPFKPASSLSEEEHARLYAALRGLLTDALERSRGLAAKDMKSEKKSGMAVHGRTGEKCPVCGDTVREVSFADKSLQYCATCQTGGKPLADRRLSKLLK